MNTVLNIVTDIATTVLPLPVLRSLRLPKRQKILLMLVFGVGFTTCIISILRLHSLYIVSRTDDLSWDNPMPAIWSSTELNVAILCSCLPTLKGLISRVAPRLLGSSRAGGRSGSFGRSLGQDNRNTGDKSPMPHELHSASPGQSPFSPKKPTFLQTDSESEVFEPDQIRVRTDVDIRQGSYVQGLEPSHALTGKEGESLKYMRANPSYKV